MWCIPPRANAEFVWRLEDVLETYKLPYDPRFPVVCMDETSKQLVGEVRVPKGAGPGRVRCIDYEYERKGTCNEWHFLNGNSLLCIGLRTLNSLSYILAYSTVV